MSRDSILMKFKDVKRCFGKIQNCVFSFEGNMRFVWKRLACVLIWCFSWNWGSRVFNELYWGF